MENKLSVKNLRVSFRTTNGKVQAVRDVSFDIKKGETLAIVGESGSGKSVTSRAILGILAGNAIVEDGEILYGGKDLLKIREEDFHEIRGDKIAMVFQDPLSSLNPIVKIGKQLTEAMILKNKVKRKVSRKSFNFTLKALEQNIVETLGDDKEKIEHVRKSIKDFDAFEYKHIEFENEYNLAYSSAEDACENIETFIFEIQNKINKDSVHKINVILQLAKKSIQKYVVNERAQELEEILSTLKSSIADCRKSHDFSSMEKPLEQIKEILIDGKNKEKVNFFAMGFYAKFVSKELPSLEVLELNELLRKELDEKFMLKFIESAENGIENAAKKAFAAKEQAIKCLNEEIKHFKAGNIVRKIAMESYKKMINCVKATINPLDLTKGQAAQIFPSSLKSAVGFYLSREIRNQKETARFDRETAKLNKLIEKNKKPDWKVVPADIVDLDVLRETIVSIIERMAVDFEAQIERGFVFDKKAVAVNLIDELKERASNVVYKITKTMAKAKAIKLMEEVGIPQPRARYNQYPFQFSGGMRQRIVIAIALAANPDILICDEPTTALDVTIQAQILELINKLKVERQLTTIFITHDLGVVANVADTIAVMYAGKIVEYGTAHDIFYDPRHPYTWALLSSMPDLDTNEKLEAIPGTPPNMIFPPKGDAFAQRNKYAMQIDYEKEPPMIEISETHKAATWLLHPDAPKVLAPKIVIDRIERMTKERGVKDE